MSTGTTELDEVILKTYKLTPERIKVMERYGEADEVITGKAIQVKEKKGILIASEMEVNMGTKDPVAAKLLVNMINTLLKSASENHMRHVRSSAPIATRSTSRATRDRR